MRYILDDSGYVNICSKNHITCNGKGCTEYVGKLPTGYEITATTGESKTHQITDSYDDYCKSMSLFGECTQNGTPTPDAPVDIETVDGITNYFDKDNTSSAIAGTGGYVASNYIPIKNGDILYKTNSTQCFFYDSTKLEIGKVSGSTSIKVNLENVAYVRCNVLETDIDTFMVTINQPIPNSYIPYGTWLPIKVQEKNYFDLSVYNYNADSRNTRSLIENGIRLTCKQAGTYRYSPIHIPNSDNLLGKTITLKANAKMSGSQTVLMCLYWLNDSYGLGGLIATEQTSTKNEFIITTQIPEEYPEGYTKIGVVLYSGVSTVAVGDYCDWTNIQLEIGSEATDYEPYKETTTLIDMNIYDENGNITGNYELCKIRDIKDELTIVDGKTQITKRIGKLVLDGSESWTRSNTATSGKYRFLLTNINAIGQSSGENKGIYCNRLKSVTRDSIWINIDGIAYLGDNDKGILIYSSVTENMTVEEFKTWLQSNNVTVYYILAEEEVITLPDANVQLFEGVNNISSEAISTITYYKNAYGTVEYDDALANWVLNEHIRAYKIVDGDLVYDEYQDAILQNEYELESVQNSPVLKKDISYTPVTIEGLPSGSGYKAYYFKAMNMVWCSIYLTGKAFTANSRSIIGTVEEGYRPGMRIALATDGLQDVTGVLKANITTSGEIGFLSSVAKESSDDNYISGWWYVG